MKRIQSFVAVILLLVSLSVLTAYAGTVPGGGSPPPANPDPGPVVPSTEVPVPPPEHPPYTVYTPKVTIVHNVNAMAAKSHGIDPNNDAVYYIPKQEDLPFSLKDYIQTHNSNCFAYVYVGDFDVEAGTVPVTGGSDVTLPSNPTGGTVDPTTGSTEGTGDTSDASGDGPVTATNEISNPVLKKVGYDLLLVDEEYTVQKVGYNLDYKNTATLADHANPSNPNEITYLTTEQAIMDIYKCLGVFEFKVDSAFIEDLNWETNKSPILSELSVLTSQEGTDGLDISQSYCGVAVSRTKASRYYDRLQREGLKSGKDTDIGNGSGILHTEIREAESEITYIEFLHTLVALMNLYGEETLPDTDYNNLISNYADCMALTQDRTEEEQTIINYLVFKGILDPEMVGKIDFDGYVTLCTESADYPNNTIIDVLSRVADPDRRLHVNTDTPTVDSAVSLLGYGSATVAINPYICNYSEDDKRTTHDILIKKNDTTTFKAQVNVEESETASPTVANAKGTKYDATSDIRLFRGDTEIKPAGVNDAQTAGDFYKYLGVETYDDEEYYHLQVQPNMLKSGDISIGYSGDSHGEQLLSTERFKLPTESGGVYEINDAGVTHQYFDDAGFSDTYIDEKTEQTMQLAGGETTITLWIDNNYISKPNLDSLSDGSNCPFNWVNVYSGNKIEYGTVKDVVNDGLTPEEKAKYKTSVVIYESTAESEDYSRVEIYTVNPDAVKNSDFFTGGRIGSEIYTTEGYYRASDTSLMISYDYLDSKNLVNGLRQVNENLWVLTTKNYNTNVSIFTGANPYIIVGDTMFPNIDPNVKLLVQSGGKVYIDYRACLGWCGDFALISTDAITTVVSYREFGMNASCVSRKSVSVGSFFPNSSVKVLNLTFKEGDEKYSGISLASSYALSPYILVMQDVTEDHDYLFVWHRNKVKTCGGDVYERDADKDNKAKDEFKKLTGIAIPDQKDYVLCMYTVYRDNSHKKISGLRYLSVSTKTKSGEHTATMGYIWTPKKFTDCQEALDTYAKMTKSKKEMVLPIFEYKTNGMRNGKFYSADVNVCSESTGDDYLSVGTMPAYLCTSKSNMDKNLATIKPSGGYDTSKTASSSTASYRIHTAPANIWAELKGLGSEDINSIRAGTIYFGTSRCTLLRGEVTLGGRPLDTDASSKAVCTYLSNGSSSVYVLSAAESGLGDLLGKVDMEIEYQIDNPSNLVDWGQFKFRRLVENMDAWSTVALIFVLNILPRVAMLLFFVLMLLSLIKDFKPWQKFCRRWFDVYKFLTLGHISVDTVNTKKLCFISLVCLSIFMIIMDGQLFNFIIFIAKFFIALYQR